MKDLICIEFYELFLETKNIRASSDIPLPPIPRVNVEQAFKLLETKGSQLLNHKHSYSSNRFRTSLEFLKYHEKHIDIVFGFYDGTAPTRTLEDRGTQTKKLQPRGDTEDVKHLCHAIIKFTDNPYYPHIGLERLTGFPTSRIVWLLRKIFEELRVIAGETENIFQITNPDGNYNSDGTPDVRKFKLEPHLQPIAGSMLLEAIKEGRLNKIRLTGKQYREMDNLSNTFTQMSADLKFSVDKIKIDNDDGARKFLTEAILNARKGVNLRDMKTFAVIEQGDNSNEQNVYLGGEEDLKAAFVKRRWFDALEGRTQFPDNTVINTKYLSEILNCFNR